MKEKIQKIKEKTMKEKIQKTKEWLKNEESQVSSESGTLTVGILLVAAGIIILLGPKVKEAFSNITAKFVSVSNGDGSFLDPLGGVGDTGSWNN